MSMKRFNGSAFVDAASVKRFVGGTWQDCQFSRRWDGSAWIDAWIPYALRPGEISVGTLGYCNIANGVLDAKLLGNTTSSMLRLAITTDEITITSGSTLAIDCEYNEGSLGLAATMYVIQSNGGSPIIQSFNNSFARQTLNVPMTAGQHGIVISIEHNVKSTSNPVTLKIYSVKLNGINIPIING